MGLYAAVRRESFFSRTSMGVSIIGISIPPFWLGIMLILVFSVTLGWLPSSGRGETVALAGVEVSFLTIGGLAHLILPGLTLSVFNIALIMRLQRAALLEELNQDYVRFARAKGVPGAAGDRAPRVSQYADAGRHLHFAQLRAITRLRGHHRDHLRLARHGQAPD